MFSQIVRYSAGHFIDETLKAVSVKKQKHLKMKCFIITNYILFKTLYLLQVSQPKALKFFLLKAQYQCSASHR